MIDLNVTCARERQTCRPTRDRGSSILASIVLLGAALFCAVAAVAQTCEDRNPAHAAALIDQIRFSCQRDDIPYSADIYSLTAVADREALPALRKIAAWPTDKGPGLRCL